MSFVYSLFSSKTAPQDAPIVEDASYFTRAVKVSFSIKKDAELPNVICKLFPEKISKCTIDPTNKMMFTVEFESDSRAKVNHADYAGCVFRIPKQIKIKINDDGSFEFPDKYAAPYVRKLKTPMTLYSVRFDTTKDRFVLQAGALLIPTQTVEMTRAEFRKIADNYNFYTK